MAGTTVTQIMGKEFDLTQAAKANFAQVLTGNTSFNLSFDPAANPKVSPAAPIAGISVAIEDLGSNKGRICLLYTSPSPRDKRQSRMPSSA